ncbi:hypothetical protein H1C71_032042, partial [Ictidomys tridecemlineatus]
LMMQDFFFFYKKSISDKNVSSIHNPVKAQPVFSYPLSPSLGLDGGNAISHGLLLHLRGDHTPMSAPGSVLNCTWQPTLLEEEGEWACNHRKTAKRTFTGVVSHKIK